MSVQMIKYKGKMVPAEQNSEGKWVPIKNARLVYGEDGIKVQKDDGSELESDPESKPKSKAKAKAKTIVKVKSKSKAKTKKK